MKAAKITAKLRDAVPVCLYAEGDEKARYKNIELPDEIKALEIMDFHFDIDAAGWISFRLHFEPGILPDEMPEPKPPVTREGKRAAKAARAEAVVNTADLAAAAAEVIAAVGGTNISVTPAEPAAEELTQDEAPAEAAPETRFAVKGERRKALALAVAEATGQQPEYRGAPSFAFAIGELLVDKTGSIIGELPSGLLETLAEQCFIPAE